MKATIPNRYARPARGALLILVLAAVVSGPASALAGGFNLSWGDCGSNGGAAKTFACNSDMGTNVMYVSAMPNSPMPQFVAMLTQISVYSSQQSLPSWWHLETPGGCRSRALSATFDFTAGPFSCTDPWAGQAMGGTSWVYWGLEPSARARLRVVAAVAAPITLNSGTEYYMCAISITNGSTTGGGGCSGCSDPLCFVMDNVQLSNPDASQVQTLVDPLLRQRITWQSSASAMGSDCAAGSTPKQSTWGGLKSLYH